MKKLYTRKAVLFVILCMAIVLGMMLSSRLGVWLSSAIAFVVAVIPDFIIQYYYRCPHCNIRFGIWNRWLPFKVCPHCGKKLDKEM